MNTRATAIISLLSLTLVSEARAQMSDLEGSDTLGPVINYLLVNGDCGNINYLAGGSGLGEQALVDGAQAYAPMSRPLSVELCDDTACQMTIGTDKLLVTRNNGEDNSCDKALTADVPGYSSPDAPAWAEVLQLVYGGAQGAGDAAACSDDARVNLINNWGQLWDDACEGGDCEKLRFAFRRDDNSGTTSVFKDLVGISAFCNGAQTADNDPIRTDCSNASDLAWCPPSGNLGVVQAIQIAEPEVEALGCLLGNFGFKFADGDTCLDGSPAFAGFLCAFPRDCNNQFGCVNDALNGSPLNPFMDGRVYNPARTFLNQNCTSGGNESNATLQIGCLVNQISCSIGYGGASQLNPPVTSTAAGDSCGESSAGQNKACSINGLAPDVGGYALARNLYVNSLEVPYTDSGLDCDSPVIGDPHHRELCKCIFEQPNFLADAVSFAGFEPLSNGPAKVDCGQ